MNDFHIDPWFSHLAESEAAGILMFDPEGVIQFVSGPARTLLQCKEEDTVEDCIKPIADALQEVIASCGCGDDSGTKEFSQTITVQLHGQSRRVRLDATRIDIEACEGTLVQVHDLQVEESIQRDLQLASRFRNLGQLYQAMAHDLRNPVGLIRMYANLLRGTFDLLPSSAADTMAKQREHLNVVVDAIKTMDQSLDLLFDELTYSEDEAGAIDVREAVSAVCRLAEAQAKRQQVTVTRSLPGETTHLIGNETKFRLALLNLVNNALQAMQDGGELTIGLIFHDNKIQVVVEDTGPGISDVLQERIFDKYYSTKQSGSGIGLHIARQAIKELGGQILLESEEGKGAKFTVTLPIPEDGEGDLPRAR